MPNTTPPGDGELPPRSPPPTRRDCSSSCGRRETCATPEFQVLDGHLRLVGNGFRCWLAGYQTGDIAPWEIAMSDYETALGADRARLAIGDLGFWCRALWKCRARAIEVYPPPCRIFCRDECLAIGMIGALQYQRADLARQSAASLLGHDAAPDAVIGMATLFASTLARIGVTLPREIALHAPIVT